MRIGIFGGSFDPIHYGHLLLAEYCREHCRLDEVWFVPAHVSPHKTGVQPIDGKHRVEMVKLAIGGNSSFRVSEVELQRGGVSYTVDTLQAIHQQQPNAELFFLLGADSLEEFPSWRSPETILQLASMVVVGRPGSPKPNFESLESFLNADQIRGLESNYVQMPLIEISSSVIRERLKEKRSIRYQVPRAVEKYIEHQELYR